MKISITLSFVVMMLLASTANAKGVPIDPGLWEMTTTMRMSMMPQPQTSTDTECIEEFEMNPEDFNMDEENPCKITEVTIDGNTARWLISCPTGGGMTMEGKWEFTSKGDSIAGTGSMTAEVAGQDMSFDMDWTGKRIGPCK